MKIRILEDVKTSLTEEEIIANIPEDVDPIGISEIKVKNCLVKYFLHKDDIVVMEVKPLPEEVETNSNHKNVFLAFLKEEAPLLSDVDCINLYRTYKNKEFIAYVDENLEDYNKYSEYAEILKSEILNRIDSEC